MPTFSAPGAGGFEMRSGEPGASISSLFLGPPESSASDTVSAVRYSHYAGVEVLGDFTDFDDHTETRLPRIFDLVRSQPDWFDVPV